MDKACDLINQGILDIFAIFSLGMRSRKRTVLQFGLLFFNVVIPLSITVSYVASGKLTISSDALSKATDVFELFDPTFIHLFVICKNLRNQKLFNQMHSFIDFFDEKFQSLDSIKFKESKNSSTLYFALKFLIIHVIGLGIDTFMLISLYPGNINWQNAIRTRVISLNILRLMSSQFIFYCDYINSRMRCFNFELEKISKNKNLDENEFLEKLQLLKTLDLKLIEMTLLVNKYFKWMLVLNISSDLIIVVIDIYWIYGGFLFGDNPYFLRKQ